MVEDDLVAFLTDFQGKVKASRGKVPPENEAVLAIAELWVERELQVEEARTKIRELAEIIPKLTDRIRYLEGMLGFSAQGTTTGTDVDVSPAYTSGVITAWEGSL
jgi:hypothetical protein